MKSVKKKEVQIKDKSQSAKGKQLISKISGIISVICIINGLFFLSPHITGNAIVDLPSNTTFFLGAGLLNVGLFAGFFYFNLKR